MTSTELFHSFIAYLSLHDVRFGLDEEDLIIDDPSGKIFVADYGGQIEIEADISSEDYGVSHDILGPIEPSPQEYSSFASVVVEELTALYPPLQIGLGMFSDITVEWQGLPKGVAELEDVLRMVLEAMDKGREMMERYPF